MSVPHQPHESGHKGPSWTLRTALFLAVAGASAGATFGLLSQIGPAHTASSPAPRMIVQALPIQAVPSPPPAPRRVTVDSVAAGFGVGPDTVRDLPIGWVDSVRAEEDGAVLIASGWAGDPTLGLRAPFVGVGACGTIVAMVPVDGERPDLRGAVHPNLDRAGWRARIFAGHLPACDGRTLEAHAVLPGGRVMAKLAMAPGALPAISDHDAEADGPASLLRPNDLAGPELARARIARAPQPLRRCAGAECAETSRLPRGEHMVAVLDRRDGWALVSQPTTERAGWLPERDLDLAPQRLAQR